MFNARPGPTPLGFSCGCNGIVKILLSGDWDLGIGLASSWVDAMPRFGGRPRFPINYVGECLEIRLVRSGNFYLDKVSKLALKSSSLDSTLSSPTAMAFSHSDIM